MDDPNRRHPLRILAAAFVLAGSLALSFVLGAVSLLLTWGTARDQLTASGLALAAALCCLVAMIGLPVELMRTRSGRLFATAGVLFTLATGLCLLARQVWPGAEQGFATTALGCAAAALGCAALTVATPWWRP